MTMIARDIHVVSVVLTGIFFFIRGVWMLMDSALLHQRWTRISAPVIDTILLVSAIVRSMEIQQYPFTHDWLSAKIIALILYIALGMVALTYGSTKNIRIIAWVGALLCFAYIASVALTRNPTIVF